MQPADTPQLRIGELSRRVGVSADLLRAWERRYGLLVPDRTEGGFRLYGEADEHRVRRMVSLLSTGISAAEAARLALTEIEQPTGSSAGSTTLPEPVGDDLGRALDGFDEARAHAAFDRLLATFALDTVLRDGVLPYLRDFGERWRRGDASIAQEHFASALLRGRLLGLARGWGAGRGPLALLACVPGDQHDLGLICFGLALRSHGWRITFLGPDTPVATITELTRRFQPALVVLTVTLDSQAAEAQTGLAEISRAAPLAIAGGGANSSLAAAIGARYLSVDPVTAAAMVAGAGSTI